MPHGRFALTNEQIAAIVGATVDDVSSNWPWRSTGLLVERGMTDALVKVAAIATIGTRWATPSGPSTSTATAPTSRACTRTAPTSGTRRRATAPASTGRGYIQLTGRVNYAAYGSTCRPPARDQARARATPEATPPPTTDFRDRTVDASAAKRDWESVRRKVNGGLNGWARFKDLVTKLWRRAARQATRVPAARPASRIITLTSPAHGRPGHRGGAARSVHRRR